MKLPPIDMFMEHMLTTKNNAGKTNRVMKTTVSNTDINKIRCPKFLKNFLAWLEHKI